MIESFLPLLVSIITSDEFRSALKSIYSFLHSVQDIEREFDDVKKELNNMRAFLEDLGNRRSEIADIKSIMIWEKEVRKDAYKVEDLIDEYQILAQSQSLGGLAGGAHNFIHGLSDFSTARHLAKKLAEVNAGIKETAERRKRYELPRSCNTSTINGNSEPAREFSSPFQGEKLFGIEKNKDQLMKWLLLGEKQRKVVSICGMAGLGKTTLVREVYNHPDARKSFEYCVWISVSQSYNLADLRRSMEEQLQKKLASHMQKKLGSRRQLQGTQTVEDNNIDNILSANRYLIVLDDVWTLEAIMGLLPYIPSNNFGSRIIFTTRDQNIANSEVSNQVLNLELMKEQEARLLFFNYTFRGGSWPSELEYWAEEIIKKCQGLPIALVAIAHVMFLKGTSVVEWEKTSKCLDWELSNNKTLKEMSRVLMLSYNSLPHCLKRCFLYCSLLPEDHLIKTNWLVKLLVAEGFVEQQSNKRMEDIAEEYIFQLCNNSMLQVVKKDEYGRPRSFRVHDLMRELALNASNGENLCLKSSDDLSRIDEYCHHVSVLGKIDGSIRPNKHVSSLRTLLVLNKDPLCIKKISSSLKLLRILELQGCQIETVADDVFQLHNLRYLGLRETKVSKIPATLQNLYKLQTLDLWKTEVTELPREILKLKCLRHLFKEDIDAKKLKYRNDGNILRGEEALSNIWELRHLQSLRTIRADDYLVSKLTHFGNFTQLRSFGIAMLDERHGYGLCNSLSRMNDLRRLSIKAKKMHILRLENLSPPPPLLQKLILNGRLMTVPAWFSSLRSLRQLYIFGSRFAEAQDPVPALQELPDLVVLALDDAYNGGFLHFKPRMFQKLKTLSLSNLCRMSQLIIEKGAILNMQQLHLDNLIHLKFLKGIDHLPQCKIRIQACPLLGNPSNSQY